MAVVIFKNNLLGSNSSNELCTTGQTLSNLNGVTVESGQPFVSRNNTPFGRGLIIYTKPNGRELIPKSSTATSRGVTVGSGQPFVSRNNKPLGRGLIIHTKPNGRELIPESSTATNRGGPRFVPVRQDSITHVLVSTNSGREYHGLCSDISETERGGSWSNDHSGVRSLEDVD
uniref:Uncharacterized protein n=1 Tax=Acrobeloides nanus TaxID=290746 RepID=A0A914EG75_9BILA